MRALIVREPFGDYAKGQAIKDPEEIDAVMKAGQAHFCTPTEIPDDFFAADEPAKPPAAAPKPAPAPAPAPVPPAAPAAPGS